MNIQTLIGVVGTLASIVGLLVAGLQTVRLRELRRRQNIDIWLAIRTIASMVGKLEVAPSYRSDSKVAEAYGKAVELHRQLLKQAVLDERKFTESTIQRWRSAGKIFTDWQETQVRQLLSTDDIDIDRPKQEPPLPASDRPAKAGPSSPPL